MHWRSVSQSLDNVHGRQVGRQPITKNRERFQHLVRLHTAIIDLFCDSVSTMTLTALRSTPQLPTTTQGPCLAIPCGEIDNRFFLRKIIGFINVRSILIGMVRGFPGAHGVHTDLPRRSQKILAKFVQSLKKCWRAQGMVWTHPDTRATGNYLMPIPTDSEGSVQPMKQTQARLRGHVLIGGGGG